MGITEYVAAAILFGAAAGSLTISCLCFKGKGPLLNNAYLFASPQQRDTMDKKPYYRQLAVVFFW